MRPQSICGIPRLGGAFAALALLLCPSMVGQKVSEKSGHVVYEDRSGKRHDLGISFSPVLTNRGEVALIRGRVFDYGEEFDCSSKATKNWIAIYDPATGAEKTLFDRPLSFGRDDLAFCVFRQIQLSPDDSVLYLVSIVYATSGALAIVHLQDGAVTYVTGVDYVYVITSGPHQGELLYQQRMARHEPPPKAGDASPYYPFVHARADGEPIRVIAEENLNEGPGKAPKVAAYLRSIGGRIIVSGRAFPN